MSDTPRTDAKTFDPYPWNNNGSGRSYQPQVMYPCDGGSWVDADFARDLERELAAAKEQIASRNKRLFEMSKELEQARQDTKQSDLDAIRALGERNDARKELACERELADRLAEVIDGLDWITAPPQALAAYKAARDEARH